MLGRKRRDANQPDIPSAGLMRTSHAQQAAAQSNRARSAFDKWVKRSLVPAVNQQLEASRNGRLTSAWNNHTYSSTFITPIGPETPGVRVTTFVDYIHPVLECYYQKAGYTVTTEKVTELPDDQGKPERMEKPMYITEITY